MDEQDIVSREYLIGTCFLCQICLRCKLDQTFLDCDCELEKVHKKISNFGEGSKNFKKFQLKKNNNI